MRNQSTGESKTFNDSPSGYIQADAWRQEQEKKGYRIVDAGGTNSLGRISSYFAGNGNLGRSGKPSRW